MLTLKQVRGILDNPDSLSSGTLKTIENIYLEKLSQNNLIPSKDVTKSVLEDFKIGQDITKNKAYTKSGKYQGVGSAPNAYNGKDLIGINKDTGNPKSLSSLQLFIYKELRDSGRNHIDSLIICRFNTPKAFRDYIKFRTGKLISWEIAYRLHKNDIPLERVLEWYIN